MKVIDTNVPKLVNRLANRIDIEEDLLVCVEVCIEAVAEVIRDGGLVIDEGGEIFDEYRNNLCLSGNPGVGDEFVKWVHDHQWDEAWIERVAITVKDFPAELQGFDPSDRKFVAVANAHPDKPEILQAVDSKWWGFKDVFVEIGLQVCFLCPDYVQHKYDEKMR